MLSHAQAVSAATDARAQRDVSQQRDMRDMSQSQVSMARAKVPQTQQSSSYPPASSSSYPAPGFLDAQPSPDISGACLVSLARFLSLLLSFSLSPPPSLCLSFSVCVSRAHKNLAYKERILSVCVSAAKKLNTVTTSLGPLLQWQQKSEFILFCCVCMLADEKLNTFITSIQQRFRETHQLLQATRQD